MSQFPKLGGGQTFGQQSATKWNRVIEELEAWSHFRVGQGLLLTKRPGSVRIDLVDQPVPRPAGMAMRFVAVAGALPSDSTKIGVYPITRSGSEWRLAIGQGNLPETTEVMRVWPHMVAADFIPFFVRTGEDDGTEPPFPFDYDLTTGVLDQIVTICPAYKVDGEWWVHNTARMSWATPASDSIFSSCGKRSMPPPEGLP